MPIETDFEQFCAARELIFSALLNVALEHAWIKNAVLEQEKFKMLLWKTGFTENRIKTEFSSKCCCQMTKTTQLAME